MEIKARQIIGDFIKKYPMSKKPLNRWEAIVKGVTWKTPAEVKQTFGSVSFVGETTVFNIGGNKWRLLSHVLHAQKWVVVTDVLTHKKYDNTEI